VTEHNPLAPEQIRAVLDEADRVCAQAEIETRRVQQALQQTPVWPDRRHPRKWTSAEYGREASDKLESQG
jgi:hypothetical protein